MLPRIALGLGLLLPLAIAAGCGSIADAPPGPGGGEMDPGEGEGEGDGEGGGGGGDGGGGGGGAVHDCRDPFLLRAQPSVQVFDPGVGKPNPWYVDGHTLVRGADGVWHMFGVTHAEPAAPTDEKAFAHATAATPTGPWTEQAVALTADAALGEPYIWGPFVYDNTGGDGLFYMFYTAGDADHKAFKIRVATSPDLATWTKRPEPLFTDGFDARSPHVIAVGEEFVMYYSATTATSGGNHVVAYRTSKDLVTWTEKKVAYTDPVIGTIGGPVEAPTVVAHEGSYYLFIGARTGVLGTDVLRSDDPFDFHQANRVGTFATRNTELVQFGPGYYMTHSGWGQDGLHLASLDFVPTECEVIETADFRAAIMTYPFTALSSFALDDGAGNFRELLGTALRGSQPYLGMGTFAMNCLPGTPASIEVSEAGDKISLRGIPMCDEPVTLDWTICRGADFIDLTLGWTVTAPPTRRVHEVAWNLEGAGGAIGDNVSTPRAGDFAGFPGWTTISRPEDTLVAAYKPGSAFSERNRYFHPKGPSITWQAVWEPTGIQWAAETYPGGTWRIGGSLQANDRARADALASGVTSDPACAP